MAARTEAVEPEELIPEAKAAKSLHVAVATLRDWRVDGRGPAFLKVGRRVFYRRVDISSGWRRSSARRRLHDPDFDLTPPAPLAK